MGCDIHTYSERKINGRWAAIEDLCPFDYRHYGLFAFLAGVRNYSAVPMISPPRGFPNDASDVAREGYEVWDHDAHSASWLLMAELKNFDYDKAIEDRRVTRRTGPNSWDGGCTAEVGGGEKTTFREFLGPAFFTDLAKLEAAGADRIVFWFDN